MKNYVFGVLSMFENELKLFKISAESKYEAVKKGMLEFSEQDENEIAWQDSEDYPTDIEGLISTYEDLPFNIIEI